jgi:hypothetical protein
MLNKMNYLNRMTIYFLLILGLPSTLLALVPVKGLILGEVDDIAQIDPFARMLTSTYPVIDVTSENEKLIENYIGLYRLGVTLKNQCSKSQRVRYSTLWKEASAKRSVAATLQYVGIDFSLKAIVEYAKQFEYDNEKFKTLADNLVTNYCNPNISVYSRKFIRDNFDYYWKNNSKFKLPEISKSPFYSEDIKKISNSIDSMKNGFNYTLKNFRAFCSWNGDTDNYFLMAPYLNNPFIMSYISNSITSKKISIESKTKQLFLEESKDTVKVACENMICRNRNEVEFTKLFPRMIGSTDLQEDIKFLYCEHFENARTRYSLLGKPQKKWINGQSYEEPFLEVNNFFSLLTQFPDLLVMSKKFDDVYAGLRLNIKNRWDRWSSKKISQFDRDLQYEEPLEIKLITKTESSAAETGRFNILFHVNMGEIDKMVIAHDKISLKFDLVFSNKFLNNIRSKLITFHNLGKVNEEKFEIYKLEQNITHQVEKASKYINIPLKGKKMAKILAKEIIGQINFYNGSMLKKLEYKSIKIPVEFQYGLFALRYLREKHNSNIFNAKQGSI